MYQIMRKARSKSKPTYQARPGLTDGVIVWVTGSVGVIIMVSFMKLIVKIEI